MSYVVCDACEEEEVVPTRSAGSALTLTGRRRAGSPAGEVPARHGFLPYEMLVYPRTQVLALGARHVAAVHGGDAGSRPRTVSPPGAVIDIRTPPRAGWVTPRFHSFPLSLELPSTGPAPEHLATVRGPSGQAADQFQTRPPAEGTGRSRIVPG